MVEVAAECVVFGGGEFGAVGGEGEELEGEVAVGAVEVGVGGGVWGGEVPDADVAFSGDGG